jgi:tetratricopeptide (TPR) repeat protein
VVSSDTQHGHHPVTPDLHPPGIDKPGASPVTQSYRGLWLSLAAVLIVGLLVVLALPVLVSQSPPESVVPVTPVAPQVQSDEAAQAMQNYLQLRAKLELDQVSRWGEPDWSQAATTAATGSRQMAQRQYPEATASYTQARERLEQLVAGREARLSAALVAAEQALASGAIATATEQFQQVLLIEPQHEAATRGLARATIREDVLKAMSAGEQAEASGDLAAALLAYQQAASLDADFQPALQEINRLESQLAATAFGAAMSRAITALDAGRLNDAGKALVEAEKLQPDSMAVSDAKQRLAQARLQAQLSRLRREAARAVAAENWQAAFDLYTRVLTLDGSAGFAQDGKAQASQRLKLHAQFDHYLDKPERVYSPEPLANARSLLAAASAAPADEPLLARKIAALQILVAQASTPIPVQLRSDGETEVAIYHVGKLGRFLQHQLELFPGNYTVTGSRQGYRDVRKLMTIAPGSASVSQQIVCEERI